MTSTTHPMLALTDEVRAALADGRAVVALESTIISHGMPYPRNVAMAREVEGIVRDGGGTLAADGRILIEGKRFTAEIKLGVRGEDAQLAEALLYVGQRMPDGRSLLRVDGTLRRLF